MGRITDSQGREVEIRVTGRYDDDIQISDAWYVDTTAPDIVNDVELQYICDNYQTELYEMWVESKVQEIDFWERG
jgi:hypothetical protein